MTIWSLSKKVYLKMFEKKGFLLSLFLFLLGILFSFFIFNKEPSFKEIRGGSSYYFINPLLECDGEKFKVNDKLDDIEGDVRGIILRKSESGEVDSVSVYYRELNNGAWFGINEKNVFSPVSLMKVPVLIASLKEAQNNPDFLKEEILATDEYVYGGQLIPPQKTLEVGKYYSVEELLETMIVYSDNSSYRILSTYINSQKISQVYTDLGVDLGEGEIVSSNQKLISVKDYSSFFRILFNASYLNEEMSEKALEMLARTDFALGLRRGVNEGVLVASKFGQRVQVYNNEHQLHDCGIVYLPGRPYLLCVMTKGKDDEKLANVIADISRVVYLDLK